MMYTCSGFVLHFYLHNWNSTGFPLPDSGSAILVAGSLTSWKVLG